MRKIAIALVMMLAVFGFVAPAAATGGKQDQITICHWNNGIKNYVRITVDENGLSGHGNHQKDIIPANATCGLPTPKPTVTETATPTPTITETVTIPPASEKPRPLPTTTAPVTTTDDFTPTASQTDELAETGIGFILPLVALILILGGTALALLTPPKRSH